MEYYLCKDGNTIGPCSIKDIQSFLHYGSIKLTDNVLLTGSSEWQPLSSLEELQNLVPEPKSVATLKLLQSLRAGEKSFIETTVAITKKFTTDKPKVAPRVMRYQNYERVPRELQSGRVLWLIITGFFLFPPRLWSAASTVFTSNIFLKSKDSRGYHRTWPRWIEIVVAVLVVINALAWCVALVWAYPRAHRLFTVTADFMQEAWNDFQSPSKTSGN